MLKRDKEVDKKELNEVITLSKKILKILYYVFVFSLILCFIVVCERVNALGFIFDFLKVISPFFIGFVIAWLLRPAVLSINKKINSYSISAVVVFSIFILVLGVILYIFIPTVYNEVNELVGLLPSFVEKITMKINDFFLKLNSINYDFSDIKSNLIDTIGSYGVSISESLPDKIISIIGSIFSGIGIVVMGLIIGIYMLIDYENIATHFRKLFPKYMQSDVTLLSTRMSTEVRKCVNGTFLVALVVLFCDSIGFAIIGLNAPLLFGLFCGITDLIPFVGPYIGGATAVIVGFTQDPLIGIGTLIICVIVQIVESYILQPVVMSKASNLHPIIIIIALLVFGHFFGILGMVLATPVLTIIRVVIEFAIEKIEKKKQVVI